MCALTEPSLCALLLFALCSCQDLVAGYRGLYGKKLMLFRSVPLASAAGGCRSGSGGQGSFQQQILSERGSNMIALLDADGDGWTDVAAAGWGDTGDPIVLLYTNRIGAWLKGEANHGSNSSKTTLYIAILVLITLLIASLGGVFVLWRRQRRSDRGHDSDHMGHAFLG